MFPLKILFFLKSLSSDRKYAIAETQRSDSPVSRTSQLKISNANQADSGRYECRIMVGKQKESIMFEVMSEGGSGGGGGTYDRKRKFIDLPNTAFIF
jgi:hypothetical protein